MARKPLAPILLDRRKSASLQDQLTAELRRHVQSGSIAPGGVVPSSRDLARELGVSRNTVIAAYDRLIGEGYFESLPRSGVRISRELRATALLAVVPTPPPATRHTALRTGEFVAAGPRPFRPSQPDVSLFPLALWNRIRSRVLRRSGVALLRYQARLALGLPVLRQALAEYLAASRGVRCDWQQIAITCGSQQAIFLLSQLLLQRGDRVWMEDPGYLSARSAFERAGARLVRLPVDEQGAIPPRRIQRTRLIYTTPSRQFPTGARLPVARRLAMLDVARRSGAWLLEDDYDSEFRYTGPPLPSLRSLDDAGRVVYLGSMSKVLFPSLRIGYVVLPDELVEPFESLRLIVEDHGPLIDQAVLAEFITSGSFYSHIRRCRNAYAAKLETFLHATVQHELPLRFPFTDGGMNQTGYFADRTVDDESASQRLAEAGLDIPPLSRFALRPSAPGLVFGFTAFDHQAIKTGVAMAARVLQPRRSTAGTSPGRTNRT